MVTGCGCSSARCVCTIEGEGGVILSGNGSNRQPYLPAFAMWGLTGLDNDQATVTVTGSGTGGDPWVVEINTLGGSVVRTVYTNDDTWTKQSGTIAQVVVIGAGGGGGTAASSGIAAGGSGGSGGAMSVAWFPLDDLPDEVDIKVGQGGAGGRPINGLTTGDNGGDSWFGESLYAPGGRGGKSQHNPAQTQHTTNGGTPPEGGPGGAGSVRNGISFEPAEDHTTFFSPTGGGSGKGDEVVDTPGGTILPGVTLAGTGGDGGSWTGGDVGLDGDDGGLYGGGGGGGASSASGEDQNAEGGAGAPGVVVVTVW